MFRVYARFLIISLFLLISSTALFAQSGHSARNSTNLDGSILSVTAERTDGSTEPIRAEDVFLYENAIEQQIKNFSFDPSPSRIVILVDNSQTLRVDVDTLKSAVMEFAYEIFEGDQLYVIAYDEKPEIIQEWTDNADTLSASLSTFRKQGNPHLFDAVNAAAGEVLLPLMPGTRKTAIVLISDGLDRGSKTPFGSLLDELQKQNITVYTLQVADRSNGAYRRNTPKAPEVIRQLTEATGGLAFPIEQAKDAAASVCNELRKDRYLLAYFPTNTSSYEARSLLITSNGGIKIRSKAAQPPNIK
ncbi:MAG: VWA domain-containing protein [Pyrinomonadaceae bacterium]